MVRKGLRIRSRSSLAKTAARSVNATISGTAQSATASAVQRVDPEPRTTASPHSHTASASSSTPVVTAMGER